MQKKKKIVVLHCQITYIFKHA